MPRETALRALMEIFDNHAYADLALIAVLKNSPLDARDRALASNLVYGTVQNLQFIDYQIGGVSKVPLAKMTGCVLHILRIAVYQMRFLTRVPQRAAVDEAVKMAKKHEPSASGFVNGILRSIGRKGWCLPRDPHKRLSVRYSYPLWIVQRWAITYGDEECERLLAAGNAKPPLVIRVNTLKTTPEKVRELFHTEDTPLKDALIWTDGGNIAETNAFKNGLITVQDLASQMASLRLAPLPGERVLDVCAAPGGKTAHMAALMENQGEITACDIHPHKLALIESTMERLGVTNVTTVLRDAKTVDEAHLQYYDKILVDAPCSGLGILRKKPDVKQRRTKEDVAALQKEQAQILEAAAAHLKPGGRLVYSTCTINTGENDRIVGAFLAQNKDFAAEGDFKTLYPHIDGTDGFFIAAVRRSET